MLTKQDIKQISPLSWCNIFCIILLISGVLYSPFLYTIALMLMVFRILFIGKIKQKLDNIKTAKELLLILILVYLLNIVGGLWANNCNQYLFELNHKLPFLIIPLFACVIMPINKKEIFFVFISYLILLTCGLIIGFVHYFIDPYASSRLLIPTARNIALSENLCLAIAFMVISVYNDRKLVKYLLPLIVLFVGYMFLAELLTGLVTLTVLFLYGIVYLLNHYKQKITIPVLITSIIIVFFAVFWFYKQYDNYFTPKEKLLTNSTAFTAEGNRYEKPMDDFIENGYYVNNYVCRKEMDSAWLNRTKIDIKASYKSKGDTVSYPIAYAVQRYINSKGLRKDAEGVKALTDKDINNIKQGMANVVYSERFSIRPRLYQTFFEFERYFKTGEINDMSIIQRYFWSKNAIHIIKQNPIIGVGTGKAPQELVAPVIKTHPELCTTFCNPHNAILYILVSFGIFGLAVTLIYMLYPMINLRLCKNHYYSVFLIILICWMFSESTFESYEGMTFISTLCSFFALYTHNKIEDNKVY